MPKKDLPPYIGPHDQSITATIEAPKEELCTITFVKKKKGSRKETTIRIIREDTVIRFD